MEISVMFATLSVLLFTNFAESISENDRKIRKEGGNKIVFPETPEENVQELPLELARRLNEVSSLEEFMTTMVTEPEPLGVSYRMGSEDVERSALKSAKRAKCMPELRTVSIKPEKVPAGVIYYPSCTRVNRCGGCCGSHLDSCQPVESEILFMSVAIAEYRGGDQLQFKEMRTVEVEQHTKCKCACKIRPEDCTKYQKYSPDKCLCECSNTDKERKCYREAPKKIWDRQTCSCVCREEQDCGSGFDFDPFSCSCVLARNRKRPSFIYEIDI